MKISAKYLLTNNKLKNKHFRFYLFLMIILVFSTCSKHYEEYIDPCYEPYPHSTGINNVTFRKTNGDILQFFNFENINEPSYCIGYRYDYEKTIIIIRYNTYYSGDTEFFQVEPLFNGATSFEIQITLKDSTLSDIYKTDRIYIDFHNGYYSYYKFNNDTNTKLTISKYGNLWDKIEGSFTSTFINYYNNLDSLKIDCQFSALRWCDQ